jgi:beta-lactamase regulating signal transducer with metallopeptidase domain
MNYFWDLIASNALIAVVLAIGAVLLGRVWKNAAAVHLLWVVVLLKLFTPPIVTSSLPLVGKWLPSAVHANSSTQTSVSLARQYATLAAAPGEMVNSREVTGTDVAASSTNHASQDELTVVAKKGPWSISTVIAVIWILGSSFVAVGYAIRIRRFARLLESAEAPPRSISTMVTRLANQSGLRRVPDVLMTHSAVPPLVWSMRGRPRLILPSVLFAQLSESAQATIVAHELAHVGRRDYLVRFLELAATTVFWWHPVVWFACSQLRDLEEQCCDSRALELVPNQARTYASALVDTLEYLSANRRVFVPLPTAVHSTGSLNRRIRMLAQNRTGRLSTTSILFIAAISAYPLVVAVAGDSEQPNKADSTSQKSAPAAAAVLSGRVTNEAGEALAGARVRVAIPAIDMRFVDSQPNLKKLETKTGANGEYRLEIPEITKPTIVSIDAMQPGYRKLVGTLMSGGDVKDIEVAPGATAEASFTLKPSMYLKGIVVDEQGKPIAGAEVGANANWAHSSHWVERTVSNADGSFELFNYSVKPLADGRGVAKGIVGVSHPDYISADLADVYALPQRERESLRFVLPSGHKIAGKLADATGKPVSNVMIEAESAGGDGRKAMMTDANGSFVLRGLIAGPTIIRAHALGIKQKVKLPLKLDSDKEDLEVRLAPIPVSAEPKTVVVLGMQLTDLTPELRAVYDLVDKGGALILDPGKDSERLKIGQLAEGYNFWMVGKKRIGSVREFIEQVLAEAGKQKTDEYSIRIVYSFRQPDFVGTNTQFLKLTKKDVEGLQRVFDGMQGK